jgi:hypothetical protein
VGSVFYDLRTMHPLRSLPTPRILLVCCLAAIGVGSTPSLAQTAVTTEAATAAERRERRWPNAGEMRERMSAALREQFQVEDDEEWRLIYERIERVWVLGGAAGAGGPMGAAMAFRAARAAGGGGEAADQARPGGGRGGLAGPASPETESLVTALYANAPEAELRSRLERLRAARKANEVKLVAAQDELRSVLNLRQEAIAVVAGLLP